MTVLSLTNVSFGYDRTVPVLRDVSFELSEGEFLSLVGPNGSGKTTLLRLIDRILLPSAGSISLKGRPIGRPTRRELARTIAFVPQENGLFFPFTALEIVLMGRSPYSRGIAFENKTDRAIALDAMKRTDVLSLAEKPITALSGGERQRVFIARALAQQPEIILLDEPNAHLDIAHQVEAFSIIKEMNTQSKLTVISVSHDLNLAAAYSDRIGILAEGSLVAMGKPDAVLTEEAIREAFHAEVLIDRHPIGNNPRITLRTS